MEHRQRRGWRRVHALLCGALLLPVAADVAATGSEMARRAVNGAVGGPAPARVAGMVSGRGASLALRDADLRGVLEQLAASAGLPVLISESVQGRISLVTGRGDPGQLLDAVLQARGLVRERAGALHWIGTLEEATARDRREREWQQGREQREPVRTLLVALRHARAGELAKMLSGGGGERLLGPRGRIDADVRTNTLLLTDTEVRLVQWQDWLAELDRPGRQVLIETRLAAVSRNTARSLGARWRLAVPGAAGQVPLAVAGAEASVLSYGLLGIDGRTLDLELSALESEGDGEVIARPSVMTAEQQKARIASGQQIPYQETTHSGASTTRFVNAELSLEVMPAIAPDGGIQLDIALSHDSPGEIQAGGARAIETNRLSTQVRLQDGQTLMLGGIFRTQAAQGVSRVPGLGKMPLLGHLFRRQVARSDRQELLIFVTPRLVTGAAAGDACATEMADGAVDSSEHFPGRADGCRQDHHRSPAG